MKKLTQKTIALACACAMLSASLLACSSEPKNNSEPSSGATGSTTAPSKEESKEPVPIHIFNRLNPEVAVDDNPILKEIESKLNIKINYEAPPINNYKEKLQITMASSDLPDIIYNWGGADVDYERWAKDGLIAELDDKLPNFPNIVANVAEPYMEAMRSVETGKIHGVARPNMIGYNGFRINQEWLDKLNLKAPTTLEEFKEVCRAFTFDDPDGNGKKDTYGLSSYAKIFVDILGLKGSFNLGNVKDTDGKYKSTQAMSGYVPYLTFIREMYAEGTLDPEFFTNKNYVDSEKQRANKVGIVDSHQGGVLSELKYSQDSIKRYTYIAPMKNPETKQAVTFSAPPTWGAWMISADSKNIDKALEVIDYGNSEEGFALMTLGIKGVDYTDYIYADRMVTRTQAQADALVGKASSYFTFAWAREGLPAIPENGDTAERIAKHDKDFDAVKAMTKLIMTPSPKTPKYNTFDSDNPDLVKKLTENEVKYIVGEMTKEQFETFLSKEYFPVRAEADAEYAAWMEANATN